MSCDELQYEDLISLCIVGFCQGRKAGEPGEKQTPRSKLRKRPTKYSNYLLETLAASRIRPQDRTTPIISSIYSCIISLVFYVYGFAGVGRKNTGRKKKWRCILNINRLICTISYFFVFFLYFSPYQT